MAEASPTFSCSDQNSTARASFVLNTRGRSSTRPSLASAGKLLKSNDHTIWKTNFFIHPAFPKRVGNEAPVEGIVEHLSCRDFQPILKMRLGVNHHYTLLTLSNSRYPASWASPMPSHLNLAAGTRPLSVLFANLA